MPNRALLNRIIFYVPERQNCLVSRFRFVVREKTGESAAELKFAIAHSVFAHWAIQNEINQTGLFRAADISAYAPAVGDIIQNNRKGHAYDYNFAGTHKNYESHSAVVVKTGDDKQVRYALTAGGNEGARFG